MVDVGEQRALIALGANLPNLDKGPAENLAAALADLASAGVAVVRASRLYQTPCFPAGAGPDYVNAAAVLQPAPGMTPQGLLDLLHDIELRHGRERVRRWGMRTLDLDLLAWGDTVLPDRPTFEEWRLLQPGEQATATPGQLILPHPRLQDRAFVLVPLADVAPEWVHPILGKSVRRMLADLPKADRAEIRPNEP